MLRRFPSSDNESLTHAQVYFQRVLSSKTAEGAELLSYMASLGCLFMAVPPIVLGAVAKSASEFEREPQRFSLAL